MSGWLNRLHRVVIALTVCHNIIPYRSFSLLFADETAPAKCLHLAHRPVCTSWHTGETMTATTTYNARMRSEERRVLAGTLVGTTIEWYDFFIYAQAAAFVLAPLFFEPLGEDNAGLAQIVSWASVGISFLFLPLG